MPQDDFSVIYSRNIVQADVLRNLLERRRHSCRLEDEYLGKMVPYAASAGGAGAVKVIVASSDVDKARRIVVPSPPENCPVESQSWEYGEHRSGGQEDMALGLGIGEAGL
jgi:hypothetical protein